MVQMKKTEGLTLPDMSELPELSPSELSFVLYLLEGMTATDAYRASHTVDHWKPESIWSKASVLKSSAKVQAWVEAAKLHGLQKAAQTREQHIRRLMELSERAEKAGNYGAAFQAVQAVGKVEGHYIERVEITRKDSVDDLFTRISANIEGNKEVKH